MPEILGTQIEAINGIAQELEIAKEYLGGETDDGLLVSTDASIARVVIIDVKQKGGKP